MTLPRDCNMTRRTVLALVPAALLVLAGCGTTQRPPSPSPSAASLIHLARGSDFDRSFIDDQIASHQELLDREEMLLGTPGQNPQLVALAKEGTVTLRQDVAELRAIQRQLPQ